MFDWFKKRQNEPADSVNAAIMAVAMQIDNQQQFRAAATQAASDLGPEVIDTLTDRFHSPTEPPDGFGGRVSPPVRVVFGTPAAFPNTVLRNLSSPVCTFVYLYPNIGSCSSKCLDSTMATLARE